METTLLLPWWSYVLAATLGIGFGCLQIWLLKIAIQGEGEKKWLLAVKFLLWAVALLVFALIGIPLLLVFVACGTVSMLCGLGWMYHINRRGAG